MKKNTPISISFILSLFLFFSCKSSEVVPYTSFDYKVQKQFFSIPHENSNKFTIAVIPDIQDYTLYRCQKEEGFPMNYREMLDRQMDFVAGNSVKNRGAIAFAVFLGDMVSKRKDYPVEWIYADAAVSKLDDLLPIGIVIGNHDYDYWNRKSKKDEWQVSGSDFFNMYFGPESKHFNQKSWFYKASDDGLNTSIIFEAGKQKFLFIGLEFEPSDSALEFAQKIVDENKNLPCIIATHSYLKVKEEKDSGNSVYTEAVHKPAGEGNGGKEIFDKLVRKNKNIVLVLCGHVSGEGMRVDLNDDGYKVYSLLADYQSRGDTFRTYGLDKTGAKYEESGDGFLQLLNFDMSRKIIHVQTYSTEFNTFEIDADSDFLLDISDWNGRFF